MALKFAIMDSSKGNKLTIKPNQRKEKCNMNTLNIEQQIEAIEAEMISINTQIENLQSQLDHFEYEVSEEEFNDFLDDCYDMVTVAGLEFYPSDILKSCDPIAYRCMKSDYESNYDVEDCAEWQELDRELLDLRYKLEDLESELEDLQNELDSE